MVSMLLQMTDAARSHGHDGPRVPGEALPLWRSGHGITILYNTPLGRSERPHGMRQLDLTEVLDAWLFGNPVGTREITWARWLEHNQDRNPDNLRRMKPTEGLGAAKPSIAEMPARRQRSGLH